MAVDGTICHAHAVQAAAAAAAPPSRRTLAQHAASQSRPPRGRAARPTADPSRRLPGPGRARAWRRDRDRRVARALVAGRRRAAEWLRSGRYEPRPGWRNLIAAGWRVIERQAEALAIVDELVDEEEWRSDKRGAWSAILQKIVTCMDWQTGLVCAVTAEKLGTAGDRSERTVSRVIAWARDVGLIVVVEHAASSAFLRTDHGRTPTYALVTQRPDPAALSPQDSPDDSTSPQLIMGVEESGDFPNSCVGIKPLTGRRLEHVAPVASSWPVFGVPRTSWERSAAACCVLRRLGLDPGGVSGVPGWRLRGLLAPWWKAGTCPAALLYAVDHHPDRPDHHRGDAFRGARDPLAVLGARLRPWTGRLRELPVRVVGIPGDYRAPRS